MADHSMVMSQSEISALKETLRAQQELLLKLHNELEAEREASATAASEALSVILRLQGEKAAIKMEAEQYKRLAEEKMCHAEESFAVIEDVIYEREMEVAALNYQVQSYGHKLLSMGFVDPGGSDIKLPEILLQRNENLSGDSGRRGIGRRNSAPNLVKYKKLMAERESSLSEIDLISKTVEEQADQELNDSASDSDKKTDSLTHEGVSSYGEQIKKLNLRVKEITGDSYTSPRNETRAASPLSSRPSAGNLCHLYNSANLQNETRCSSPKLSFGNQNNSSKVAIVNDIEQTKHPANLPQRDVAVDHPCALSVHDVFEVPQADWDSSSNESSTKGKRKTACQASDISESKGPVLLEDVKPYAKDENDWLKKLLQSTHDEKNSCKPSDVHAIDRTVVQPNMWAAESDPRSNQSNGNSGICEVERRAESTNREEELKYLKEMKEKLNLIHDEIRSQREKKSSTRAHPCQCIHLPEAMLYFWL